METVVRGVRERAAALLAENAEVAEYAGEMWARCLECGTCAWRLLVALGSLLAFVGVPASKRLWTAVTSQRREWLVAEATAIAVCGLLLWFRRWLRKSPFVRRVKLRFYRLRARVDRFHANVKATYERMLKSVGEKSRLAATMLPHLAYLGAVLGLYRAFPRFSAAFWGAPQLSALLVAYQLVLADIASRGASRAVARYESEHGPGSSSSERMAAPSSTALAVSSKHLLIMSQSDVRRLLKFWAVAAAAAAACALVFAAPYGPDLWEAAPTSLRRRATELRGIALLWLQLPLLEATELAFGALRRVAVSVAPSLASAAASTSMRRRQTSRWKKWDASILMVQNTLSILAPPVVAKKLAHLKQFILEIVLDGDSWIVLAVAAVAFCTVGPPARLGAVTVGIGLPLLSTVRIIGDVGDDPRRSRRLLAYWFVIGARDVLLLNESFARVATWVPLKPQLDIAACLWLQLPYTAGADKIRATVDAVCNPYLDRFKDA